MSAYALCQSAGARLIDPSAGQSLRDRPWSRLVSGYAVSGLKRPKWLDDSPRLALSPWADTVAGRRADGEWLDGRAREEKAEKLSA